ncbi:MAG: hypothetical protein VB112_03390 [Oscillospiraceae bacterium]|nr:hypothetical protein [Oscillospiraceae bacterium]
MKKFLALALCLGVIASCLTACGGSNNSSEPGGTATSGTTVPETSSLPEYSDAIALTPSETAQNDELKQLIISTFAVPEEYVNDTYYFYNYVDLNGDGTDEIVASVVGPYVSGNGGDSGLIIFMEDGKMVVNKQLSLVHMPLIVSDETIGGWKMIIAPYSGGGEESAYHMLRINDEGEKYFNIPDGDSIETLEGVTGTAILYNDAAADIANGTALCLGK